MSTSGSTRSGDPTLPAPDAAPRRSARFAVRRARVAPSDPIAEERPVAVVVVDLPLAHLDRPFDYAVPAALSADAVPGARVRVRVAGQELGGFILERRDHSEFPGSLQRIKRVVSAEPVLSDEIAELSARIAARYAGTRADVLRLAVPPRLAKVEAEPPAAASPPPPPPDTAHWAAYLDGPAFLSALGSGRPARAVWSVLPGSDWPGAVAAATQATLSAGRGALIVAPDARDVDRLDAALAGALGPGRHVALTAALGPTERYRRWLAVRRGAVRAVVGTRAAMFAPVADLGLAVVWDDGDDLHAEPRAPYPHVREVLAMRAAQTGAGLLLAGFSRTAEGAQAVRTGWARSIAAPRTAVRAAAPLMRALGEDDQLASDAAAASARLPSLAWQVARDGLQAGPVLVQVPRAGYVPSLACGRCRAPARCPACTGPLQAGSGGGGAGAATCGWCGVIATDRVCSECGDRSLRAVVVGIRRTAEELGRSFPNVPVVVSSGEGVLASVPARSALVLATPGAEPTAAGGYAAALLLDGWALLSRPDLRAGEEALRRWFGAAALVRPGAAGGRVVVAAANSAPTVQALLRWDPAGHADRELEQRRSLGFPPAGRLAAVDGTPAAVQDFLAAADLPEATSVLGPTPRSDGRARVILRTPREFGGALTAALAAAAASRSARRAPDPVRVQVDPCALT